MRPPRHTAGRATPSKTLVVAPYVGEFGWELMNWQGRVRWLARHGGYERILVVARPDRRPLYADRYARDRILFCPIADWTLPGRANEDHRIDAAGRRIDPARLEDRVRAQTLAACADLGAAAREASFLMPGRARGMWPTTAGHQVFVNLRVRGRPITDIVLVPRYRSTAAGRNRPRAWWEALADRLRARGLCVETYVPRVDRAIVQLSRARLAVGASTGGLHLASLCGCPHYVWGSGPEARWTTMRITNRQRYETVWNPLGTPCRYDECGWSPSLEHVCDAARRALDEIGIGGAGRARRRWSQSKWRIRRGLARILEPASGPVPWPWKVRALVRHRLV